MTHLQQRLSGHETGFGIARDPSQLAKDAAALVSLVTGVVVLARLVISGVSAVPDVLYWAGWVYIGCLVVLGLIALVEPQALRGTNYHATRAEALFFFALGALWLWFFGAPKFMVAWFGGMGSFLGLTQVAGYVSRSRDRRSVPFKACPECAESVKAAAKVCRFCGYRFTP